MNSNNLSIENIEQKTSSPVSGKLLPVAAVLAGLIFACTLCVRLQDSEDLGYHIAYGDEILSTGEIVDTNPYIYTLSAHHDCKPGPGGYWDKSGKFRFYNANWLSQVVISWVNHRWGMVGLSVLAGLLGTILFLLIAGCMHRLKITGAVGALAVVLIAIASGERLYLRPELFTYVLLAGQIFLLLPALTDNRKLGWVTIAGLTVLQIILVNVHSYFLLTILIVGAITFEKAMRYLWCKKQANELEAENYSAQFRRLAFCLAGVTLACFVNPFTYHMPYMPIETLIYFKKHNITTPPSDSTAHPMSEIGEFYPPFAIGFEYWAFGMKFYLGLLSLAGVSTICAIVKRKWAAGLIVLLMIMVSLSMRRNIAVACLIMTPISIWLIWQVVKQFAVKYASDRSLKISGMVLSCFVVLVSAWLTIQVVNNSYYIEIGSDDRAGLGISKTEMPISAAVWIDKYNPTGKLWCDYNSSSNIYYLTKPHRSVPILTNTWAYPHSVMKENIDQIRCEKGLDFDKDIAKKYGVGIVLLRTGQATKKLLTKLSLSPDWAIVDISARYVLFVRKLASNQALIASQQITYKNFDTDKFIAEVIKSDPANPAQTLTLAGSTLAEICFPDHAIKLYEKAIEYSPNFAQAYHGLSFEYANLMRYYYLQAKSQSKSKYMQSVKNYKKAESYCKKALEAGKNFLELNPNSKQGRLMLEGLKRDLKEIPVVD